MNPVLVGLLPQGALPPVQPVRPPQLREADSEQELELAAAELKFGGGAAPRVLAYTSKDVVDNRISVPAQHSLVRLSKAPLTSADAVGMLEEIKSGRLGGIYCVNWQKPAQRSLRWGQSWWTIIPKGEHAILMLDPGNPTRGQPLIAFRRTLHPDCGLLSGEARYAPLPDRLDQALLKAWSQYRMWQAANSPVCTLVSAHPIDVASAAVFEAEFPPNDAAIMNRGFADSRRTLRLAANALSNLLTGFAQESRGKPLNAFQKRVLLSVGRWLKVNTASANRAATADVVRRALALFNGNLGVRTSSGRNPSLRRVAGNFHAQVFGDPDRGVELGDPFFTDDGPNCRRDVITHEFFHFLRVGHGGSPTNGPTIRANIVTPDEALDSADNLAQLVSEIMNGRTDACTRSGD
jgi:hypothetical protein